MIEDDEDCHVHHRLATLGGGTAEVILSASEINCGHITRQQIEAIKNNVNLRFSGGVHGHL